MYVHISPQVFHMFRINKEHFLRESTLGVFIGKPIGITS